MARFRTWVSILQRKIEAGVDIVNLNVAFRGQLFKVVFGSAPYKKSRSFCNQRISGPWNNITNMYGTT